MSSFSVIMTAVVPVVALHLLLVVTVGGVGVDPSDHQHLYTDSFPKNDEYDLMGLDPNTPYGTPYGGFSRATSSRLAGLPLKLPSTTKELLGDTEDDKDTGFDPMYTTVRDNFGRAFACRVFHEDELEPSSLGDSMFDTPILKKEGSSSAPKPDERKAAASEESTTKGFPKPSEVGYDPVIVGHTIQKRFSKLTGLCAQKHPSAWWSYEWCHERGVKQFHVKISKHSNGKIQKFELEDITSLGKFSKGQIHVPGRGEEPSSSQDDDDERIDPSGDRREIGTVVHTFVGGDRCDATGEPRVTQTAFRCCSENYMAKTRGGVLKNSEPFETDLVSVLEVSEDKEAVCHYNITLCTPMLCDDYEDDEGASAKDKKKSRRLTTLQKLLEKSSESTNAPNNKIELDGKTVDPTELEKMSVVELLDLTFGKDGKVCMQQLTGQWWNYEFCAGDSVRQFHEEGIEFVGYKTTKKKDLSLAGDGFTLGRFFAKDHEGVTKENEWEHVVNATTTSSSQDTNKTVLGKLNTVAKTKQLNGKRPPAKIPFPNAGGNGAYYFQEYTKGDVCDDPDVTDYAVKAGEYGEGGIERAITVRYACNNHVTMSVKEDSTCHYVVDITVPTLCHHPLFKAPVSKKQIVKCLPIAS